MLYSFCIFLSFITSTLSLDLGTLPPFVELNMKYTPIKLGHINNTMLLAGGHEFYCDPVAQCSEVCETHTYFFVSSTLNECACIESEPDMTPAGEANGVVYSHDIYNIDYTPTNNDLKDLVRTWLLGSDVPSPYPLTFPKLLNMLAYHMTDWSGIFEDIVLSESVDSVEWGDMIIARVLQQTIPDPPLWLGNQTRSCPVYLDKITTLDNAFKGTCTNIDGGLNVHWGSFKSGMNIVTSISGMFSETGCRDLQLHNIMFPSVGSWLLLQLETMHSIAAGHTRAGDILGKLLQWDLGLYRFLRFPKKLFADMNYLDIPTLHYVSKNTFLEPDSYEYLFENNFALRHHEIILDFTDIRSLRGMFKNALNFNADITHFETSLVTNVESMFEGAISYNSNLEFLNVTSVSQHGFFLKGVLSYVFRPPAKFLDTDIVVGSDPTCVAKSEFIVDAKISGMCADAIPMHGRYNMLEMRPIITDTWTSCVRECLARKMLKLEISDNTLHMFPLTVQVYQYEQLVYETTMDKHTGVSVELSLEMPIQNNFHVLLDAAPIDIRIEKFSHENMGAWVSYFNFLRDMHLLEDLHTVSYSLQDKDQIVSSGAIWEDTKFAFGTTQVKHILYTPQNVIGLAQTALATNGSSPVYKNDTCYCTAIESCTQWITPPKTVSHVYLHRDTSRINIELLRSEASAGRTRTGQDCGDITTCSVSSPNSMVEFDPTAVKYHQDRANGVCRGAQLLHKRSIPNVRSVKDCEYACFSLEESSNFMSMYYMNTCECARIPLLQNFPNKEDCQKSGYRWVSGSTSSNVILRPFNNPYDHYVLPHYTASPPYKPYPNMGHCEGRCRQDSDCKSNLKCDKYADLDDAIFKVCQGSTSTYPRLLTNGRVITTKLQYCYDPLLIEFQDQPQTTFCIADMSGYVESLHAIYSLKTHSFSDMKVSNMFTPDPHSICNLIKNYNVCEGNCKSKSIVTRERQLKTWFEARCSVDGFTTKDTCEQERTWVEHSHCSDGSDKTVDECVTSSWIHGSCSDPELVGESECLANSGYQINDCFYEEEVVKTDELKATPNLYENGVIIQSPVEGHCVNGRTRVGKVGITLVEENYQTWSLQIPEESLQTAASWCGGNTIAPLAYDFMDVSVDNPQSVYHNYSNLGSNTTTLLGMCKGNCDNHSDCETGLTCITNGENTPGCTGMEPPLTFNICYDATWNNRKPYFAGVHCVDSDCDRDCMYTVGSDEYASMCDINDRFTRSELARTFRIDRHGITHKDTPLTKYNNKQDCESRKFLSGAIDPIMYNVVGDNPSIKLGRCEGDCDSDSDCRGALICHQRNDGERTPGCYGAVPVSDDFCYESTASCTFGGDTVDISKLTPYHNLGNNPHQLASDPPTKLSLCEGHCRGDTDCGENLICHQRSLGEITHGCSGDAPVNMNFCFDPELEIGLSPADCVQGKWFSHCSNGNSIDDCNGEENIWTPATCTLKSIINEAECNSPRDWLPAMCSDGGSIKDKCRSGTWYESRCSDGNMVETECYTVPEVYKTVEEPVCIPFTQCGDGLVITPMPFVLNVGADGMYKCMCDETPCGANMYCSRNIPGGSCGTYTGGNVILNNLIPDNLHETLGCTSGLRLSSYPPAGPTVTIDCSLVTVRHTGSEYNVVRKMTGHIEHFSLVASIRDFDVDIITTNSGCQLSMQMLVEEEIIEESGVSQTELVYTYLYCPAETAPVSHTCADNTQLTFDCLCHGNPCSAGKVCLDTGRCIEYLSSVDKAALKLKYEETVDCDGVLNGDKTIDACGHCGGDGSSCADLCGVPNGNNACVDCDGIPNGDKTVDACGHCGGDGSSCADLCGVPNGNNACVDCDGIPNGDKTVDACGHCGGDGSSCADQPGY